MNLGPDTVHYQETTGLHSLYWAYHIVWDYLPCFILSLYSFVLFMCVSLNTWPAPLLYLSSVGRGGDHSEVQEGSMQANGPVLASRSACWPLGPTPTTKAELSLSPLHVSKALLHSVFDCTVFSLTSPLPMCSGQKCVLLVLLLVVSNRCHLLNSL